MFVRFVQKHLCVAIIYLNIRNVIRKRRSHLDELPNCGVYIYIFFIDVLTYYSPSQTTHAMDCEDGKLPCCCFLADTILFTVIVCVCDFVYLFFFLFVLCSWNMNNCFCYTYKDYSSIQHLREQSDIYLVIDQ